MKSEENLFPQRSEINLSASLNKESSVLVSNNFNSFQVSIVKLKMDKDRTKIIERRAKGRAAATGKDKGKYTEENMETSS